MPSDYTTEGKDNIDVKKKIKELCNNIYWGTKPYSYNKENKFDVEKFYTFITTQPNERNFVKTFLPSSCFNTTVEGKIGDLKPETELKIEILALVNDNNRQHRQHIFGIYDDVKPFIVQRQFYEIYSMNDGSSFTKGLSSHNCHPLVNWTNFLNMLYSKCAIYNTDYDNKDNITFPIRFILPKTYKNVIFAKDEDFTEINNTTDMRSIRQLKNIFNTDNDTTPQLTFIGFITIKFKYKINKDKDNTFQFRNWILLVFRNEETHNFSLVDYITGELPKYLLLNYNFEQVNTGSLTKK